MSLRSRQSLVLGRSVRGLWLHLPALAAAGAAVAGSAGLADVLAGGLTPVTPLLVALLAGPPAAAMASVVNDVLVRDDSGIVGWWRALRRTAGRGITVLLVPAVPATLLVVAVQVERTSRAPIALVPVWGAAVVTVLAVAATAAALPATVARPALRGIRLWVAALHLVARHPVRFGAAFCLFGLGVWASVSITGTLFLLVPAPVGLLAGAAFWSSAVELGAAELGAADFDESRAGDREPATLRENQRVSDPSAEGWGR